MKHVWLAPVLLALLLAGCSTGPSASSSSKPALSSSRVQKSSKKPAPKPLAPAKIDDLMGHYYVNMTDKNMVLQFTASTSGYFMEVLTRKPGYDFASSEAGIFQAQLKAKGLTYTISGQPQANSQFDNKVTFKKRPGQRLYQEPDGPVFKKVKHDDLNTLSN